MTPVDFDTAFDTCPLVAILRGLAPDEAPAIGDTLVDAGFTLIEIPLNSPDPLVSISALSQRLAGRALVGAGTVLTPEDARAVHAAGGRFVVSPNTDAGVIGATRACGMASLPGYFTATEAFAALAAGATALKLFPADAADPAILKAHRAVLPASTRVLAVGGMTARTMVPWIEAGAAGFGLGSNLYKPGKDARAVAADARDMISEWSKIK